MPARPFNITLSHWLTVYINKFVFIYNTAEYTEFAYVIRNHFYIYEHCVIIGAPLPSVRPKRTRRQAAEEEEEDEEEEQEEDAQEEQEEDAQEERDEEQPGPSQSPPPAPVEEQEEELQPPPKLLVNRVMEKRSRRMRRFL